MEDHCLHYARNGEPVNRKIAAGYDSSSDSPVDQLPMFKEERSLLSPSDVLRVSIMRKTRALSTENRCQPVKLTAAHTEYPQGGPG